MKKFILFILIIGGLNVFAQDGTTLHFMRLNPYSNFSNPSSFLQYKGYVGVPVISNINIAATNTGFHYNTLFGNDNGTITTIKLNDFVNQLSQNGNYLNTNLALNIIDFGFRTKHLMVSFSYRIRVDEFFSYNKDLFALPVYGNMKFVGEQNAAKPNFNLCFNAYQEFGIGFQAQITPHIYIGARPKLLFGFANAKTNTAQATLYTNPDDYSMKLNYQLEASIRSAIPINIGNDFNIDIDPQAFLKDFGKAFKNVGAAIDLGATYRINDHWGVSASVLDLGFICWNTGGQHIYGAIDSSSTRYNDGSFLFNGLTIADIEKIQQDPEGFKNELLGYFPLRHETLSKSTTALSSRFLVEGYYNLGKYHRFSALFQGRIINRQFIPSFTIAWNGNFLNIFDLCVNYTIAPHSYTNLGVGVGFNLGVFHIYAATDNLIAICNSKSVQRSLLNANNANVQVGIVFDWGKIQESKLEKEPVGSGQ